MTDDPKQTTIEQFVRDLLYTAIEEGLVRTAVHHWVDPDPQVRSSGELVRLANMIRDYIVWEKEEIERLRKELAEAKSNVAYWIEREEQDHV